MESKWRKLKNTAFIEEDKAKTFNGVFYIISLGKRELLHINLVFNLDKLRPGEREFYEKFKTTCEKSGAFRGYKTMFAKCKSHLRKLCKFADKIYVFGSPKIFYQSPGDYIGFRCEGKTRKIFFTTIFDTILFIIEDEKGVKFVDNYEKEIIKCIKETEKNSYQ
ncbi:MAG: hypothetical protein DRJ44_08135 [Thermoprotei archaeon]|nr:MAG: hypothetical protein DRJ44_08135 [Thermoprotei archaeon]